jgi:pseudaminic acid cytidylyltransferase
MDIAIIPARGGSKRIPRKNIKVFHGRPVISYAIKAAQESGLFEEVYVSTDDDEIAEIAMSFGAQVPWIRSRNLADDHTGTTKVIQDAVVRLDKTLSELENVCCIYPATPMLKPEYLQEGLRILNDGKWDYVVTVSRAVAAPERLFLIGENGGINLKYPQHETTRTQDLAPTFYDAGQFYWGKKSSWVAAKSILSDNSTILELPRESAIDIDTIDDWQYSELMYKSLRKQEES